jgi:membrane peptidoglycan carboxypeptidase
MASTDDDAARPPEPVEPVEPVDKVERRGWRTGEWPVIKIDLSVTLAEAYANVRRRDRQLRRRRVISGTLAAVILAGVFSVVGVYYVSSIPLPDALSLPATTTVYYSDGTTVMARLGSQNRSLVRIATLPDHIAEAVIAAEDPTYWLDSTTLLSRQYARAAAGIQNSSPAAQARLLVMTWKLEDTYDKDQILEFYLNTVYFGRGAYGVEAAARAYFDKRAAELTIAESIVLAGLIESPGDGRYDPSVSPGSARLRFVTVAQRMVSAGSLEQSTVARLQMPAVEPYDVTLFQSGLDRPTGLVVAQVLAELRESEAFRDKPPHYLEEGGFRIVTTIDARAQELLEHTADETVTGSLMHGQPDNLQAAAVVVEPGTGRVLAYYGGHDGTGADYAGWYTTATGEAAGFGAHPPGETMTVYALAAALAEGISVRSVWDSPEEKAFPADGRGPDRPVHDYRTAPCQPRCTLTEAANASLDIPIFALTQRLGPAKVIDVARAAGVGSMWVPEVNGVPQRRYDLAPGGAGLTPEPFGPGVGLGEFPVTVLDQASAMATFAADAVPARTHFVRSVTKDFTTVHTEQIQRGERVLGPAESADLTWALSQSSHGILTDGRTSATQIGVGPLRTSAVETAHAWTVGYTRDLAMAVWIGNEEIEFPLKDEQGARVLGSGLPAEIYRAFMSAALDTLDVAGEPFPEPRFTGDEAAGDAPPAAGSAS